MLEIGNNIRSIGIKNEPEKKEKRSGESMMNLAVVQAID